MKPKGTELGSVAARKAGREIEAAQAMREYQAEKVRVDANTARLRALRLAKEAADAAVVEAQPKTKPKAMPKATRRTPARASG